MKYAYKGGRGWNGNEKDSGSIIHIVPPPFDGMNYGLHIKALCGIRPGDRSLGWSETKRLPTCPKCIKIALAITDISTTVNFPGMGNLLKLQTP